LEDHGNKNNILRRCVFVECLRDKWLPGRHIEHFSNQGSRPRDKWFPSAHNNLTRCTRTRSKNTIWCLHFFWWWWKWHSHIATEFTPCGETVVWSFNLCCLPEQVMPQWLRDKWLPSGHHRIRGIRILDFIIEIVSLTRCTRRRSRNTIWCLHLFWW